ncbi:BlaI/MecI/CopY family transcriptional regulator [Actinopolymorpha singaporensis]|uniref:Predicted transcriptional regulator n=1 Tax=Actinopolymorpha singaporensis TaxID=117157 RepID=A0A1H1U139_9ACTN|nr:BlaI/MecI/CopY family transcriptional regulator [Actinopolymorpha singaporensis]SDS66061.1 Predicted transcriptional regulator [Actinopolymorpha singaporensis]
MAGSQMRPRGGLEREVLACLAAADRALSANEVLADLGGGLAYTTVMTTLGRLHAKGLLSRQLDGRAYVYTLAADPGQVDEAMAAHRMRRVLDSGGNHAGVLARFVEDLSPEDAQVLAALLAPTSRDERKG